MNDAAGSIKQDVVAVTPAVWASALLKLDIQSRVRVLAGCSDCSDRSHLPWSQVVHSSSTFVSPERR